VVETDAADGFAFDEDDIQSLLRAANGRGVATWAGTDDSEVGICWH
jgi:hypothetical protein